MELKGKIINFLGDSLTEGVGVEDRYNHRYTTLIERECGCKRVNNYGVGGSRIAHQFTPSEKARHDLNFCGRCWDMDKEADIVVVFGGCNDYFHGDAPFGDIDDQERTTFCGAVNYLCRTILELYPDAVHAFIAPSHCKFDDGPSRSVHKPANAAEHRPLIDYVNAILTIAPKYGFHTYSMYDNLGIDPKKPEDKERYAPDGTHFNDLGHSILAKKIIGFLRSI